MQKQELINFWKERLKLNPEIIDAFNKINRENFVLPENKGVAYQDTPLPILRGKTISQPTTVMIMTLALEVKKGHNVFEVGSGSGYQTSILAHIVGDKGSVVSTDVIPELVEFARQNIKKVNLKNVKIFEEDGSKGLQEQAPYDRIIITAACKEFPQPLLEQLKPGGIIVGPVGDANEQEMVKGVKDKSGRLELHFLGQFLFSPLYGKYGFEV
ncbi:MAG: protein-L-isoaspartate(D-aspartate) O-methyltransferase [Candidatus Woesearchaeota archaeon]|jgi:protein-L-isoaspartate(D-aspartate) O-methyltransferase|nr:protein-L-isoaspartate(D-aspartate) O-methyltransferase [Candidatus Woesearchaeota archaeon]MDP7458151.1 protein-L-isoaspartate(D-aspartate) O-methyltransferase [Candidatus Woesearchaeota archaeon]